MFSACNRSTQLFSVPEWREPTPLFQATVAHRGGESSKGATVKTSNKKEGTLRMREILGDKFRTYKRWNGMIARCHRPTHKSYHRYGGKGIIVCDRWRYSFDAFLSDMGILPDESLTIDRKDNSKGYEPGNCRWATVLEQANNTSASRTITYKGITQTYAQWDRALGLKVGRIRLRITRQHMTIEQAMTVPRWKYPKQFIDQARRKPRRKA